MRTMATGFRWHGVAMGSVAIALAACGPSAFVVQADAADDADDAGDAEVGVSDGGADATVADGGSDAGDATRIDARPPDAGASETPAPTNATTGIPCTAVTTCDPTGTKQGICETQFPTPVCVQLGCKANTSGGAYAACDGAPGSERGWCIDQGASAPSICLPKCTFTTGAAPPIGCQGSDLCEVLFIDADAGVGEGICAGGCLTDADCSGSVGPKCQVETGICVATASHVTYTGALGTPCNPSTATSCVCLGPYSGMSATTGYCTSFCKVGAPSGAPGACGGSNFFCSAFLEAPSTAQPAGIAGQCVELCSTDADCTAFGSAPPAGACTHNFVGQPAGKGICALP